MENNDVEDLTVLRTLFHSDYELKLEKSSPSILRS